MVVGVMVVVVVARPVESQGVPCCPARVAFGCRGKPSCIFFHSQRYASIHPSIHSLTHSDHSLIGSRIHSRSTLASTHPPTPDHMSKATSTKKTAAPKTKALAAKKAALKGVNGSAQRKVRTSTTFRLPKTLHLRRAPRYPRKSVPRTPQLDQFTVLKYPLNSESAMRKIENQNTLVFVVDVKANKAQIKDAVKRMYDVDAAKINTLIRWVSTWREVNVVLTDACFLFFCFFFFLTMNYHGL